MANLTDEQLDKIEARLDLATAGGRVIFWTDLASDPPEIGCFSSVDLRALVAAVRRGRRIEAAARRYADHCGSLGAAFEYTMNADEVGEELRAALAEKDDK